MDIKHSMALTRVKKTSPFFGISRFGTTCKNHFIKALNPYMFGKNLLFWAKRASLKKPSPCLGWRTIPAFLGQTVLAQVSLSWTLSKFGFGFRNAKVGVSRKKSTSSKLFETVLVTKNSLTAKRLLPPKKVIKQVRLLKNPQRTDNTTENQMTKNTSENMTKRKRNIFAWSVVLCFVWLFCF